MSGEQDWNKKSVRILSRKEGNTKCADCGEPDPQWASYTLGVFVCVTCCGIHRNLPEISKVKSLTMAKWEEDQIQFLDSHGNNAAKAKYEAHVPVYYYRPTYADCHVLREQWIRAKYERQQFMKKEGSDGLPGGVKEGILFKRGRDNGQYLARKFVLTEMDGTLKYFIKPDAKEPKAVIKIDSINATFQPEKMKHSNGLQITYVKDNRARNVFVYHNDGQEIVSWFNAIRAAQFHYMKVAFPTANDKEILSRLPQNFLKEGYMEKTGPKDAFAKGEVFLGSIENGYQVTTELVPNSYSNVWNYGISISTPERTYLFTCESEHEWESWLSVFKKVISIPMTVREYAVEAQFKHRS
ncbi:hypothetical protein GDO78_009579 [Eleutherodactylus coqui]|uniref:Uncharacterized protein n=1 Tax=Eleutherodactylus coqui TaxID=57060 RepID=A0A8J6K9M6_ELECQ|nr:hypothetical protein GDO78_009579 [Eleutherodactylus coqui]